MLGDRRARARDGGGVGHGRILDQLSLAVPHHRDRELGDARRSAGPVAYILLADRKIWAAVQMRRGPNVVGPFGLLQTFADLLKFVLKELIIPAGADKGVFLLAPLVTFMLAFGAWAVIPFDAGWVIANINVGVLYLFADLVAGRLRHHHGRLGVELEISVPGRRCARRRRW